MRNRNGIPHGGVTEELYHIVKEQPAIHFRGLKRAADLSSNGQLRHHLDQLESENALIEVEDGGYTRYFIPGEYNPELRNGLARFARSVPRTIGKLLLNGPLSRTELREALGCADSTLGYHLNRMMELGDLERDPRPNRTLYKLVDPPFVARVLQALGENVQNPHDPTERTRTTAPASGNA